MNPPGLTTRPSSRSAGAWRSYKQGAGSARFPILNLKGWFPPEIENENARRGDESRPNCPRRSRLADQRKASEITFRPLRLELDHRAKRADRKCVAGAVECERDPSPVSVAIALVRTALVVEHKPITDKCTD